MEQGASMESVAQFLLSSDGASGKKHYHWNCNCALHGGQCSSSSSSPARVLDVQKKGGKKMVMKSISARSSSVADLTGLPGIRPDKRLYSMGNLLELLDSSRSNDEIRRDAANKEPL